MSIPDPAVLAAFVGLAFLAAVAAEGFAIFVEQTAAGAKKAESDPPASAVGGAVQGIVSMVAPGLLLLHGYFVTVGRPDLVAGAVGLPVAALVVGAILGRISGAVAQPLAHAFRPLALPAALLGFAIVVWATWPSIQVLLALLSGSAATLPVQPV